MACVIGKSYQGWIDGGLSYQWVGIGIAPLENEHRPSEGMKTSDRMRGCENQKVPRSERPSSCILFCPERKVKLVKKSILVIIYSIL